MRCAYKYLGVIVVAISFSCSLQPDQPKEINPSLMLWYDQPAVEWTEALPLGNGRIGAMVFGQTEKLKIHVARSES